MLSSITKTLQKQYELSKSSKNVRTLKPRDESEKSLFAFNISNSMYNALSPVIEDLRETNTFIEIGDLRLISVKPEITRDSKYTEGKYTYPASAIFAEIPKEMVLLEVEVAEKLIEAPVTANEDLF